MSFTPPKNKALHDKVSSALTEHFTKEEGIVFHELGTSVQNVVTQGGSVLSGLSMRCGTCRKECVVQFERGQYTTDQDIQGKNLWCPYCGVEGRLVLTGHISDLRVFGDD